jgi:hypothetical protein
MRLIARFDRELNRQLNEELNEELNKELNPVRGNLNPVGGPSG